MLRRGGGERGSRSFFWNQGCKDALRFSALGGMDQERELEAINRVCMGGQH